MKCFQNRSVFDETTGSGLLFGPLFIDRGKNLKTGCQGAIVLTAEI